MLNATKLQKGAYILLKNQPYKVVDFEHSKQGRAGAVVRTKLKQVITGKMLSVTFKGDEKVEEADISSQKMQYLYSDGEWIHFMNDDFEQSSLPKAVLSDRQNYLQEGLTLDGVFLENKLIDIKLPAKVALKVIQAEPGVKGDSTNSPQKLALLETGYELSVPLFIKQGDVLRVNTETGEYVERISNF